MQQQLYNKFRVRDRGGVRRCHSLGTPAQRTLAKYSAEIYTKPEFCFGVQKLHHNAQHLTLWQINIA